MLSTINWVLGHPTTEAWLRLACTTGQIQEQRTQHIARFLMEITLFHKEYIAYKPSELAVASLLLARFILGKTRRVSFFIFLIYIPLSIFLSRSKLLIPSFFNSIRSWMKVLLYYVLQLCLIYI